jgi:hypothetical protein
MQTIKPHNGLKSGVPVYEFYLDDINAQIVATTAWNQKS